MIVLVSGSTRASECAAAVERKTHQKTLVAATPALAIEVLQEEGVDALVIDESMQHAEGGIDSLVDAHGGMAVPIYVNLSLHAADRIAQEVGCGLERIVRERCAATRAAVGDLRNELRGEVTAILLNADLALRERSLAPGTDEKLRVVRELAERMRGKLDSGTGEMKAGALRPRLVTRPAASSKGT